MRFLIFFLGLLAALVAAVENPFTTPEGGYQVEVGKTITLDWLPTTEGKVTIMLQWGKVTEPEDGIVVASGIDNTGSTTWKVPDDIPSGVGKFFFRIYPTDNPELSNYSPRFDIQGLSETTTETSSTTPTPTKTKTQTSSTPSSTTLVKTTTSAPASSTAASSTTTSSSETSTSTTSSTSTSTSTSTSVPNTLGEDAAGSLHIPVALAGVMAAVALL